MWGQRGGEWCVSATVPSQQLRNGGSSPLVQIFMTATCKLLFIARRKCIADSADYAEKQCFVAGNLLYQIVSLVVTMQINRTHYFWSNLYKRFSSKTLFVFPSWITDNLASLMHWNHLLKSPQAPTPFSTVWDFCSCTRNQKSKINNLVSPIYSITAAYHAPVQHLNIFTLFFFFMSFFITTLTCYAIFNFQWDYESRNSSGF